LRLRSGRFGHNFTDAIAGLGASVIHSWPHFWQRNLMTMTPGRSQVPAEKGQPVTL